MTGLTDGTPYYFVVRAKDSAGNEDTNTVEYSVTPTAPADTTPPTFAGASGATDAGTGGAVTLTWAAASDPSTPITYDIYWATTAGGENYATPNQTSSSGTGATVTGLTNGTPYYFVVRAKDSAGNEESNAVEVTATPTAPVNNPPTLSISQPDGLGDTVNVGSPYNITYTLNDPDDVVTAAFYWDTNTDMAGGTALAGTCAAAPEGSGVTCSWDTTGMTPGQYYIYGTASDGVNPAVSALSPGVITINGAPNAPATLAQFAGDGVTPIASDGTGTVTDNAVVIQADLSDPNSSDEVMLEVDLDSNGTVDCTSALVTAPGNAVQATCQGLADGAYNWQVRAKDAGGLTSAWTPFTGTAPQITVAAGMDLGIDTTRPSTAPSPPPRGIAR